MSVATTTSSIEAATAKPPQIPSERTSSYSWSASVVPVAAAADSEDARQRQVLGLTTKTHSPVC